MSSNQEQKVTFKQLLMFFIPLGVSSSLITISHVIINSTLARSANPEIIIACYALPMSILGLTEKPALLMRQTCSALVRDRVSFRAMSIVNWYVLACVLILGSLICYTPLGRWVFLYFFGASEELVKPMIQTYQVLMFVSIFSALRCMYQGIIIFNMRTKWLTIGMFFRLSAMYSLSLYYIQTNQVNSAQVGAIIFLVGMMVEAAVSVWEGRSLLKKIPEKKPDHPVEHPRQIFHFYKPLLYSSIIAVIIGPSINAFLGKTMDFQLAVASFTIAASLTQLVISFFSYIHQIVLNFYRKDPASVMRFTLILAFIPGLLIAIVSYTPLGPWFMQNVMGVNERLMHASLDTLRVFTIMTLVFPWLDFGNGLVLLRGETKLMVWSQAANVATTLITLTICILLSPGWNGMIGALAQSFGVAAEATVVWYVLRAIGKSTGKTGFRSTLKS
ncbi:multi antimicrobial extrusion protein MatE [Paenibacillus radicis (ex Xue et al. 2023)]|uniref:Multi antimicrobial extrusion protein MatE n=1 Tax=Paenibacillus radicis (ex Xue et al. 2023) TaxID=2972489 RepID=A0ABT1YD41_9BACL|nr:multi antimicrobial extrusion protein MatE [Paenibacillus radicis (ex Xue et al. 2023)]MCR8631086.1 multi antimicrobial extrusion protein MatE [Paenibacillus radicis (ex Xue et al. 2023)]